MGNSDAATRAVAMLLVILLERDSGAAIGSDYGALKAPEFGNFR